MSVGVTTHQKQINYNTRFELLS